VGTRFLHIDRLLLREPLLAPHGSVARHEGRGVLDVVSRMSVLLCLGLYGCTTTALTCAMHDKIQSIR
jgi:hypothetical protein